MTAITKPYQIYVLTRPCEGWCVKTPGHALIALSRNGCDMAECCLEAWGFYPEGVVDELGNDDFYVYDRSVAFPITDTQRQLVEAEVARWRSETYILGIRDCTDFVVAVLAAAGIRIVDKLFPGDFGAGLELQFGRRMGVCQSRVSR